MFCSFGILLRWEKILKKIIVVEDEDAIREFVVINLRRAGYDVIECSDGISAKKTLEDNSFDFDVAILDIMIPGIDGIELCKFIRKNSSSIGIIILTAKSQEMDKISGLMHGADDYVIKPFSPTELVARVDALYRRVAINSKRVENNFKEVINMGRFSLNLRKRTLEKDNKQIDLTKTEFQIMEYFFSNPNHVLTRKDILDHVWEGGGDEKNDEKIVDVNIRRLRMKVEDDPSHPKYIVTLWKSGYKWDFHE